MQTKMNTRRFLVAIFFSVVFFQFMGSWVRALLAISRNGWPDFLTRTLCSFIGVVVAVLICQFFDRRDERRRVAAETSEVKAASVEPHTLK